VLSEMLPNVVPPKVPCVVGARASLEVVGVEEGAWAGEEDVGASGVE
jgi:hypothetical protein